MPTTITSSGVTTTTVTSTNVTSTNVDATNLKNLTVPTASGTVVGTGANYPLNIDSSATADSVQIDSSGRLIENSKITFLAWKDTSAQSISGTTWTKVTLDTVASPGWNVGSHFDTSTSRFTAPISGMYFISYNVQFGSASNGYLYSGIRINQAVWFYGDGRNVNSHNGDNALGHGTCVRLAANDYVELFAYHQTGTALGYTTARTHMCGYLVSII